MKLSSPNVETVLEGYRLGSDQGAIAFCSVTLVEGLDEQGKLKRILVDTGHTGRRPALDAALRQRGLTPDSIDTVVCTHAHWDHIENLDIFPRAEIVMHSAERLYARRPHRNDYGCPDWIDAVLARYEHRVRTVEEGTRLLPGVEVVAAPGHSAGTMAVAVAASEGIAVVAGDAIQNAIVARAGRNELVFWNDELASKSVAKLVAIGDIIYPGHDLPFRLLPGGQTEYLRGLELTISGIGPDEPGLVLDPAPDLRQTIMPGIGEQRLSR